MIVLNDKKYDYVIIKDKNICTGCAFKNDLESCCKAPNCLVGAIKYIYKEKGS